MQNPTHMYMSLEVCFYNGEIVLSWWVLKNRKKLLHFKNSTSLVRILPLSKYGFKAHLHHGKKHTKLECFKNAKYFFLFLKMH
jgi:hypothetical protein